jgi:hypothetical protein
MVSTGIKYASLGPKVGDDFFDELRNEEILFDSKRVWVTFSLAGFKGKKSFTTKTKRLSRGRLILTARRLICIIGKYKLIDIPRGSSEMHLIRTDRSNPKRFTITCNLEDFGSGSTGVMTISYHLTPLTIPTWH